MAFNAGGTNVGGIKQIPAGSLVITPNALTGINNTGVFTKSYTVPAGKMWNLLAVECYSSSFSGTLTANKIQLNDGTDTMTLYSVSTTGISSTIVGQNFYLPAGYVITISYSVNAYTSGDLGSHLCYLEIDA